MLSHDLTWTFITFFSFTCGVWIGKVIYKAHLERTRRTNYENYTYLVDNIRSCGTFGELETCSNWVDKLSYEMEPSAVDHLKKLMGKKMEELEKLLQRHKGDSHGGVQ